MQMVMNYFRNIRVQDEGSAFVSSFDTQDTPQALVLGQVAGMNCTFRSDVRVIVLSDCYRQSAKVFLKTYSYGLDKSDSEVVSISATSRNRLILVLGRTSNFEEHFASSMRNQEIRTLLDIGMIAILVSSSGNAGDAGVPSII